MNFLLIEHTGKEPTRKEWFVVDGDLMEAATQVFERNPGKIRKIITIDTDSVTHLTPVPGWGVQVIVEKECVLERSPSFVVGEMG